MKINSRLLLITFGIIVVVSITSTVIFFSLTTSILESKLSNTLLKSSYDFALRFQNFSEDIENEFNSLNYYSSNLNNINIDTTDLDFIFPITSDLLIDRQKMKVSSRTFLNFSSFNLNTFVENNPNLLLRYAQFDEKLIFFGKVLNEEVLNLISNQSRIEIILLINGTPNEKSHSSLTNQYLPSIINAANSLSGNENFSVYSEHLMSSDFYTSIFSYDNPYFSSNKIEFLLFITSNEVIAFRETMSIIMLIILFAGSALALIFVMIFTTKLRKQISYLNRAAESASKGDFTHEVSVISKDEIGRFASIFNQMLSELRQKEKREKEYSDFLTLLNQNPTLEEISNQTLRIVLDELKLDLGTFFLANKDNYELISSIGVGLDNVSSISGSDIHKKVVNDKKPLKLSKKEIDSFVKMNNLSFVYCIILPIIYQKQTIAFLEIAGNKQPEIPAVEYFELIHDQLAVGIINANNYTQLEKLVKELRVLNEEYQKQNERITDKNEQLVKLHTELKHKAEELEKQKSKAVELTNLKSQFLASVSHELRTPLNSIIGLTELVLNDSKTVFETKKRLAVVLKSGQKLMGLINNILDYLKIESGKIDIKKESFVLSVFLKDLEAVFDPLVREKKLNFIIDYNVKGDLLLITDRRKLEQILINIVGNAVKFTNKGFIKISVSLEGEKLLKINVSDSGIGIKKENIDSIFEEFRQGEGGTKRKYEGTGLGLSISKEYTNKLGGEIFVRSEYRKGSVFTLLFNEMVMEKIDVFEPITFEKRIPASDKNDYVLLVVDNEEAQKIIYDYLELNGFKVRFINPEENTLDIIKENTLAIIIDANLKRLSAWKLLNEIKDDKYHNLAPVIVLSIDEKKKVGYGLDVFEYFCMPLTSKDIFRFSELFKKTHEHKLDNILIISDSQYDVHLKSVFAEFQINCDFIGVEEDPEEVISKNNYSLILIDIYDSGAKTIDKINILKHNHSTRYLPIVCGIPLFEEKTQKIWSAQFSKTMFKMSHHPMDALKVIRDRLQKYFGETDYVNGEFKLKKRRDTIQSTEKMILVVDDDSDTLYTMGELLKDNGYNYSTAGNGVECLFKLNSINPSLILMDIMMPQMDGFETLKRIKDDKKNSKVPVIALTAYAMLENREIIDKHGFADVVTKPIDSNLLIKKINKYIN